ncbi:flagellin [Methanohalobium evestigatum Z-7303]|uniref:Flagellin n=1 Tax=Methanohalobium evestigatum (strain ATCC BAA-1072 / DSM 3721 / NBRC 107634 / OCM 161 / Z-7303) TaxID=644295 RepID=D7E7V5_METEZ|nr:flagellin [Methanohalobium evestigatum]ADI74178.1 flagellin [Methanohalobium evestigatum Z-7303]
MQDETSKLHLILNDENGDTAVSHMIFFIAAVIIAVGVAGVLSVNVESIMGAASTNSDVVSDQLKTDITIISDPEVIPYNSTSDYYTFYVKNTGKSDIALEYVNVILDGEYIQDKNLNLSLQDSGETWKPLGVLIVNVTTGGELNSGDHGLKVVSDNGISDTIDFKT